MFSNIICCNCGIKGHIYKYCDKPITSYGIICKTSDNRLVLVRRRDSLGYTEFIRGKYLMNITYLQKIYNEMTNDEKNRIKSIDFHILWEMFWNKKFIRKKKEYYISENKHKMLLTGVTIDGILISFKYLEDISTTNWLEAEWGFPKGRRNFKESDVDCAKREFEEETNCIIEDYSIIDNDFIVELFVGSDNITYKHVYYIAILLNEDNIKIDNANIHQLNEIGDIRCVTKDICISLLRPYNKERIDIVNNLIL